jgi:hypothetical protein
MRLQILTYSSVDLQNCGFTFVYRILTLQKICEKNRISSTYEKLI